MVERQDRLLALRVPSQQISTAKDFRLLYSYEGINEPVLAVQAAGDEA